jgi:hypothetical protein
MLSDCVILRRGQQVLLDEISETLKKGEIPRLDARDSRGVPYISASSLIHSTGR